METGNAIVTANGSGKPSPAAIQGRRKVLIIGAGSTGLALAHGLKKAGIPFLIFEKDESPIRKRNWSMGLHWGFEPLEYLVPADVLSQVKDAQVDPHVATKDSDRLPLINGQTGELITEIKSSKFYRFRRDKFRAMLLQGLDVQWGKDLVDLEYSPAGERVIAKFGDGSEVIGSMVIATDGPHSAVRSLLVGEENAKVTPIDFASTMCFTKHTREHALFLRAQPHHPLYQVGPHPDGYCAWLSLHDGDDVEHPENWTFFHYISFPEKRDEVNNRTMREHVAHQKQLARNFVDPWRSVFKWMPEDSEVWYSKLRNWDPSLPNHKWDNRQGRITLAGDAAHPMTFQRGQGLNHAIQDAYTACKAIESFWNKGDFTIEQRAEAIQLYEDEMVARTGVEVRLSEENSEKMHDWTKIMNSPTVLKGMAVDK
ncbi:putative monooxygenase [Penicillium brasilianum]|uniref:Putative monooxygenase n=1 Tax=Penicillium brasilianum TaxID=104259 RepID=A0A1S9RSK3_PENBI|nr:putative monooxygenase [Penicillium brasilianum]